MKGFKLRVRFEDCYSIQLLFSFGRSTKEKGASLRPYLEFAQGASVALSLTSFDIQSIQ